MRPVLRLLQIELRSAGDHFLAEIDIAGQRFLEGQRHRLTVNECQHVDEERGLHDRKFIQIVDYFFLQVKNHPELMPHFLKRLKYFQIGWRH